MAAKKPKIVNVFLTRKMRPENHVWERMGVPIDEFNKGMMSPGEEPEGGIPLESDVANRLFNAGVIKLENPFDADEEEEAEADG